MGQEISQPNKNNIGKRQGKQEALEKQKSFENSKEKPTKFKNNVAQIPGLESKVVFGSNDKLQQQLQQPFFDYHEKSRSHNKFSHASSPADYRSVSVARSSNATADETLYYDKLYKRNSPTSSSCLELRQHQRKHSQGSDSGIYCVSSSASTSRCSASSAASTITCGSNSTSASGKSFDKHKSYLSHHLYIKSYLDILEEDERERAHFKAARPGIRNYTPKILAEASSLASQLSTSGPTEADVALRSSKRSKVKDDPWI